jgi:hypothetical protein
MSNLLTIQQGFYSYDINGENGKMFAINHQFLYSGTVTLPKACCGTMTAYVVTCNDTIYYIPDTVGVPTTIVIPKQDQSFPHKLYNVFLQNQEHHTYREINNNCTNCNGLIPHGDYSNNNLTPGYKDPDIVFNNGQ